MSTDASQRREADQNEIQTMDEKNAREGLLTSEQGLRDVRRSLKTHHDALALLIADGCRNERKLRPIRQKILIESEREREIEWHLREYKERLITLSPIP